MPVFICALNFITVKKTKGGLSLGCKMIDSVQSLHEMFYDIIIIAYYNSHWYIQNSSKIN